MSLLLPATPEAGITITRKCDKVSLAEESSISSPLYTSPKCIHCSHPLTLLYPLRRSHDIIKSVCDTLGLLCFVVVVFVVVFVVVVVFLVLIFLFALYLFLLSLADRPVRFRLPKPNTMPLKSVLIFL